MINRFFEKCSQVWIIIGIILLCLVLIELFCQVMMLYVFPLQESNYYPLLKMAYGNAQWIKSYSEDFNRARSNNWIPYIYWHKKPFKSKYINIDKNGMRKTFKDPVSQLDDQSKPLKIFVFGGSTIWGVLVRDDYTIPSELSKLLTQKGYRNIEIFNLGEEGYVTTQELIQLHKELQKGNIPDIVIFYDGFNDAFTSFQSGKPGIPQNEFERVESFKFENSYNQLALKFARDSISKSALLRLILTLKSNIILMKPKYITYQSDILAKKTVNNYISNLNIIMALSKEYNFDTLFYWHPVLFNKKHLSSLEKNQSDEKKYMKSFTMSVYNKIKYSNQLQQNKNFVNLSEVFVNSQETVFIDHTHLLEKGNTIIAQHMMKSLLPLIKKHIQLHQKDRD